MNRKFSYYDQTFIIDYVYNYVDSLSMIDNIWHERGLCKGMHLDHEYASRANNLINHDAIIARRDLFNKLMISGLDDADDQVLHRKKQKCNIVCEHSLEGLKKYFKDVGEYTLRIKDGYLRPLEKATLNQPNRNLIADKIDSIMNDRDPEKCEIGTDQWWNYNNGKKLVRDTGYIDRLTWLVYDNKLFARQFLVMAPRRSSSGSRTWPGSGGYPLFIPNYIYRHKDDNVKKVCDIISESINDKDTGLASLPSNELRYMRYLEYFGKAYKEVKQEKIKAEDNGDTSFPNFSGKCMRVCNITDAKKEDFLVGARVGLEYLKLQEFFGGLKADFYDLDERQEQVVGFVEEVTESSYKFSEWNPGIHKPESTLAFELEEDEDLNNHDFEDPIKSIELIDVDSNAGDYTASIEDDNNACVIKALNRYIYNSNRRVMRLMIDKMHFEADGCVLEGEKYLKALGHLQAVKPENGEPIDKASGDKITVEYMSKPK
ncbi:MAG: hypothetical protein OXC44_03215 [Proteobacteria bacterium]|nr:hypothetical protein [Pseudomonadota bacterium]